MLIESEHDSTGQLFWSYNNHDFNESQSQAFPVRKGIQTYQINLPNNLNEVSRLRLDPCTIADNSLTISYLLIKRKFHKSIDIKFDSLYNYNSLHVINKDARLTILSNSIDPHFTFSKPNISFRIDFYSLLMLASTCIFLFLFANLCLFILEKLKHNSARISECIVPVFLLIIFISSIAVALTSKINASPDELDHFYAAEYFKTHIDTPPIKVDAAAYTYNQQWGYSRVYQLGRNYMLAGQFSNLISNSIPSFKSVRLFGVFLIFVLLLLSIAYSKQSIILLPFIMTPQAWYVFSYINDDYFPLFLSFTIFILTEKNKEIFIQEISSQRRNIWKIILFGITLSAILTSKTHFLIVAAAYVVYISILSTKPINPKDYRSVLKMFQTPLLILTIALAIVGIRSVTVSYQKSNSNVSDTSSLFYKQIESNRELLFETNRSGKEKFAHFYSMVPEWTKTTYESFNGVYGYMQYYSPPWVYNMFRLLHLLLILQIIYYLYKKFTSIKLLYTLLGCGVLITLIIASSYFFSYLYDYQPQGRYLLPFIPVFGLIFTKIEIPTRNLIITFSCLFLLSLYSFFTVGLLNLSN